MGEKEREGVRGETGGKDGIPGPKHLSLFLLYIIKYTTVQN